MSDLHLDHIVHREHPKTAVEYFIQTTHMLPYTATKDDILVLAGDTWVGYKWVEWSGWSWIKEVARRFYRVVVCHGNHCLWSEGLGHLTDASRKRLEALGVDNVSILDNNVWEDPPTNTIFVGGTLWTDMDGGNPLTMYNAPNTMGPDFKYVKDKHYQRFTSEKWTGEHAKTRDYIKHVVKNIYNKNVVAVTHHAPAFQSCHPKWAMSGANGYYASSLEGLMYDSPITHWVHGHVHDSCNYFVDNTNVLCNPYGYRGDNPEFSSEAHFVIGD